MTRPGIVNITLAITDTELTEEEFFARFKPMRGNHTGDRSYGTGVFGDCYFEDHGKDEKYVLGQDLNRIWTLVDGEKASDVVLLSGFHLVNRCGYLIATEPVEPGHSYFVNLPGDDDGDGDDGVDIDPLKPNNLEPVT